MYIIGVKFLKYIFWYRGNFNLPKIDSRSLRHLFHFINIISCISLISSTNFEEMLGNKKASRTLKAYPLLKLQPN